MIVMQRLHQDDLVGHVIEKEDWGVLSIPAIAPEDTLPPRRSSRGRLSPPGRRGAASAVGAARAGSR